MDLLALTRDNVLTGGGGSAGLTQVFYAERHKIATIPVLTVTPTSHADLVSLNGDITMIATEYFNPVLLTPEQGKLKQEYNPVNADNIAKGAVIDLFLPRLNPETLGFIENVIGKEIVWIIVQCGQAFILGNKDCAPVRITEAAGSSGKASSDGSTLTYQLKQFGSVAEFYTGVIPLAP